MAREVGMSGQRGGHLYMQTSEIRNAVVHYRWSASRAFAEVERIPTATTCVPCQFELEQRPRKYAHRPSTAARHRSSPARAGIEDGIANRPSKVRDPL